MSNEDNGFSFCVYGNAVPKQSFRYGIRNGKMFKYQKQDIENWQNIVAFEAKKMMAEDNVKMIEGEVAITMYFYFNDKKRRDLDNLSKAILDALNGIAWKDDNQVTQLLAEKVYLPSPPYVHVMINDWDAEARADELVAEMYGRRPVHQSDIIDELKYFELRLGKLKAESYEGAREIIDSANSRIGDAIKMMEFLFYGELHESN